MAYETGAATGTVDLVNKLATFIEANGWTRDDLSTEASGRRYHAHRGSQYLNMRAFVNEAPNSEIANRSSSGVYGVAFNIGTGYSGGTNWYKQAGAPTRTVSTWWTAGADGITGAITAYHFFAQNSGDQIYVVLEYTSGKYQYFGWGLMEKYGSFTGGDFMFGSNEGVKSTLSNQLGPPFGYSMSGPFVGLGSSNGSVGLCTVDVDAETGWRESLEMSSGTSRRRVVNANHLNHVANINTSPNSLNNLAAFLPFQIYVSRTAASGPSNGSGFNFAPIGLIPNIFSCSIAEWVPSQQVTLGSDNYRVFPWAGKGSSDTDFNSSTRLSGYHGLAIKE